MRSTTIVALCAVLLVTCSEASAQGTFITQFERGYGTVGSESGRVGIETSDGGFIAAGEDDTPGLVFVVKTDSNGEVVWQRSYGAHDAGLSIAGVLEAADGGFVIGANIWPSPRAGGGGFQDGVMIKTDIDGIEEWRTVFGGDDEDSIYNIVLADDGGYVGTGGTWSTDIAGKDPVTTIYSTYAVKVSSTGAVVREAAYQGAAETFEEGYNLVKTPEGGFMINAVALFPSRASLLRLDANLDKLWLMFYGPAGTGSLGTQSIENTPDGGFIASGVVDDFEHAFLIKFDPAPVDPLAPGGPLGPSDPVVVRDGWPKLYASIGYDILYGVDVTADGGYIAAGHREIRSDPEDPNTGVDHVWAIKVDANGDLQREGVFGIGGAFVAHSTADGGYVVIGGSADVPLGAGGDDLYLLKLRDPVDPGFVIGAVYLDGDETCSVTDGDVATSMRLVKLTDTSNANFLAITNASGNYQATLPAGDYLAQLAGAAALIQPGTCDADGQMYSLSVPSGGTLPDKHFFTTCNCQVSDELTGNPLDPAYECPSGAPGSPCPGYPWQICYDVTNLCLPLHQNANGNHYVRSCVNLPAGLEYLGAAPTITTTGCNNPTDWHLVSSSTSSLCFEVDAGDDFRTNCHTSFCFPTKASTTPLFPGGSVTAQFSSFHCPGNNAVPAAAPLVYDAACACDPNAMHVTPPGCGAEGSITGQELTYRIDFQNLGAGAAGTVVVTDQLDADLDPETLRMIGASHEITALQVDADGELVATFEGIDLPPAGIGDDEASHGHLTFAISPRAPFDDGTTIDNSASIVFDTNSPVITDPVVNTLYNGDPVPIADFDSTAAAGGEAMDFTYTGGTADATFAWDFGPNATPRISTDQDPTGVVFSGPGQTPVVLVASKAGCDAEVAKTVDVPCDSFWTTTGFDSPVGRLRRINSKLRMRFRLSYLGLPVVTSGMLDSILASDFGMLPDGGCWPRLRVFTADRSQELALDAADFAGMPANPDGCFRFGSNGRAVIKLRLRSEKFVRGDSYAADVEAFTCTVSPANSTIMLRP